MSTLLAQLFGGILGLAVAWLMNYCYTKYQESLITKLKIKHKQELDLYKEQLRKSLK